MGPSKEIRIDTNQLDSIKDKIPASDFINSQFDLDNESKIENLLVILSTQRSGSTMLAGILHKNDICLPHEYMQPYDYLPLLAERWSCIKNGLLDKESFIKNLVRHRTYSNGWLGLNLHGTHLKFFMRMSAHLPDVNIHYVHLIREDVLSQAVSYEIASQTGQWTSSFEKEKKAVYSFRGIKDKLDSIQAQNILIKSFLKGQEPNCQTIYYEHLVASPGTVLGSMACIGSEENLEYDSAIKKQSTSLNKDWVERFSNEYLLYNTEGTGKLGWLRRRFSRE